MRGARVRLELLQFACLIVSQLGSISTLCLIPTVHSFSSLRVQRNTHGVLANPDLSQAMAPSKKKRTHAVFCISSAHRLASTSKPRFVGEKICLNQVIRSLPASKAVIKKKAATEYADGLYPAFSASGQDVWLPDYRYNCHGVVVSAVGARCGKAFKASGKWNVVANTHPLALDEERIDWDYAWRLLNNENWWIKSGSGQPFVKVRESLKRSIYLPPLSIQKQFAANLRGVESQISIAQRSLAALDSLIKSRFVEMFEESDRYNGSVYRLADIGEIASGITKGRKARDKELFETPYLSTANVQAGRLDLSVIKTIDATMPEIEKFRLAEGDVLMTEGGDPDKVGRGAVAHNLPKNCIHQNHVFRVRLNRVILYPEYFEMFLQSPGCREYFFRASKQTTGIATINKTQLRNMQVLVPPIKAQEEFLAFASQVDKSGFATHCDHLRASY